MFEGSEIELQRRWRVGRRIGGGGFGNVYEADDNAVAKFVPKAPGAERELLFVDVGDVRNVVPVIDSGETDGCWVLIMPRAAYSLRDYLVASGGVLDTEEAVAVLTDIATALVDLDGRIVHRDLKPENVLELDGQWSLADFGISRYAEATTAPDTQKFALTAPYAAPERWRAERATSATDVYTLGVMAYEMIRGEVPFRGSTLEEFREAHLHSDAPHLEMVPPALASLVDECLYKASGARPSPANLLTRLQRFQPASTSSGLSALQEANREATRRRAEASRLESVARTEEERRESLATAAQRSLERISDGLREALIEAAPAAEVRQRLGEWSLRLGDATLTMSSPDRVATGQWGRASAPFDVILAATLSLHIPRDRSSYEGRSHSLWFGDVQVEGAYEWFETAFMVSPFIPKQGRQDPFALRPSEEAAEALLPGLGQWQLAWPFTSITGTFEDFVDRWSHWFAAGASGHLGRPGSMPEKPTGGSWRR